jgi:hypothetical protein
MISLKTGELGLLGCGWNEIPECLVIDVLPRHQKHVLQIPVYATIISYTEILQADFGIHKYI